MTTHLCKVASKSNVIEFCGLRSKVGWKVCQQTGHPIELCYPLKQGQKQAYSIFHLSLSLPLSFSFSFSLSSSSHPPIRSLSLFLSPIPHFPLLPYSSFHNPVPYYVYILSNQYGYTTHLMGYSTIAPCCSWMVWSGSP